MSRDVTTRINNFMKKVKARNPGEPEFHQAVREVSETLIPFIDKEPRYKEANILERLVEPERVYIFRVPWVDDKGKIQVNRGIRVQFNSAIGPYKGGLRFHPSVNLSVLKFLAFEQVMKNGLTTLPLGGAKGGSDFDPKNKSVNEIMRFCQSFMIGLHEHIGNTTDIPAGDIGVGAREIGFLFGQYKRLQNVFTGVLTGKGLKWGGSYIRPEATGYGTVYFLLQILKRQNETIDGKRVAISGSGNVALFAVEKILELGGQVVTLSDSSGAIHIPKGLKEKHLKEIQHLKNEDRGRLKDIADRTPDYTYYEKKSSWQVADKVDVVIPCATQNELDDKDAKSLIQKGVKYVAEGANMPCTAKAVELFQSEGVIFAPGKAANAGGVAVSGLEMAQNAAHVRWTREKTDHQLLTIMKAIHKKCVLYGKAEDSDDVDYVKGANLGGFIKVADAMIDQGAV